MEDEIHYKLLKVLEENPDVTQRELADRLGISLGKGNYCLRALNISRVRTGVIEEILHLRSGSISFHLYHGSSL